MTRIKTQSISSLANRKILYLILFILVVISTSNFIYLNFFSTWSDAAGFVSLLDQIMSGNGMVSPMYNAGTWFFEINSESSLRTWCDFPSVNRFENFSRWHPYLILFPIGVLTKLLQVSPLATLSFLTAVSYLSPIAHIFYNLIFKKNYNYWHAVALISLVVSFPVWFGGLEGQLQSDRLFVGPAYFITFSLLQYANKRFRGKGIIALSISICLTALISERAAIYLLLVVFVVMINLIFRKEYYGTLFLLPSFTVTILYLYFWNNFIQDSTYYGQSSLTYFRNNFINSFTEIPGSTLLFIGVIFPFVLFSTRDFLSFHSQQLFHNFCGRLAGLRRLDLSLNITRAI